MDERTFLNLVIDDGLTEVVLAYPGPNGQMRREGCTRGFEDCRGLDGDGLLRLRDDAREATAAAMRGQAPDYWFWRCRELQVEWVLNVLSAARHANGMPTLVTPTMRGMAKAAHVLNGIDPSETLGGGPEQPVLR